MWMTQFEARLAWINLRFCQLKQRGLDVTKPYRNLYRDNCSKHPKRINNEFD